jgi:large subunit ribosomal protein L18
MADKNIVKQKQADRRRLRVRKKVMGTVGCPRLTVAKSLKNVFAQIIDDENGVTLVALASNSKSFEVKKSDKTTKTVIAKLVGKKLAEMAKEKGIESVVFDRNKYRFHGRIKALADGAREGGLQF